MKRIKVLAARSIGGVMGTMGRRSGRDATKTGVSTGLTLGIAVAMLFALTGNSEGQRGGDFCSQIASTLFTACRFEVNVNFGSGCSVAEFVGQIAIRRILYKAEQQTYSVTNEYKDYGGQE